MHYYQAIKRDILNREPNRRFNLAVLEMLSAFNETLRGFLMQ